MSRLSVHVGSDARSAIDALAERWELGNAETVRRLVVVGLGGTLKEGDALNAMMRKRRESAEAIHKQPRTPGARERASIGSHAPIVTVRLPGDWIRRVREFGGLRAVLQEAIDRVLV